MKKKTFKIDLKKTVKQRDNKFEPRQKSGTQHNTRWTWLIINLSIGRFWFQLGVDKKNVNHHGSDTVCVIELDLRITAIHSPSSSKGHKYKTDILIADQKPRNVKQQQSELMFALAVISRDLLAFMYEISKAYHFTRQPLSPVWCGCLCAHCTYPQRYG